LLVTNGADIARLQHPLSAVHVVFVVITMYQNLIVLGHRFIVSLEDGFMSHVSRSLLRWCWHFIVGAGSREAMWSRLDMGMRLYDVSRRRRWGAFIIAIDVLGYLGVVLGRHELDRGELRWSDTLQAS
jgi:hypothetical protein